MKYKEFLDNLDTIDEQRDDTNDQIAVIVRHKDEILCAKNGKWNIPSDHVKFLETPEVAAVRELSSEFNIDIEESKLMLLSIKLNKLNGKLYLYSYQCRSTEIDDIECEGKYDDFIWSTIETIPSTLDSTTTNYIKDFIT